MTTTKFSPGDSVCFYEAVGWRNPVERTCGIIKDIDFENQSAAVAVKKHAKNLPSVEVDVNVPLKNLRRLKKKTRVVWESDGIIVSSTNKSGGLVQVDDAISFSEAIAEFIGKRVRI